MSNADAPMADEEMRPVDGVVLGRRWGDPPPEGGGGSATDEVALLGERWRVEWTYEANALVAVALCLTRRPGGIDVALRDLVGRAARAWLGRPLVARDEAYWVVEAGATRLTWDGLDGRLAFEDTA